MRGLILKDFINMKGQAKVYILFIVLWGGMAIMRKSGEYFNMLLIMIPAMTILTAIAYDDRYKWNRYALTMPVTRKDLIVSKYVFSFIFIAGTIILSMMGQTIMGENISYSITATLIIASVVMIINGVSMPIFFYFGTEHGRIVFFAAFALIAVVLMAISNVGFVEEIITADGSVRYHIPTMGELILILLTVAFVVTAVSMLISVKIYENKDF